MTDCIAIERMKTGRDQDFAGFNHLYQTYKQTVKSHCQRVLKDFWDAEDVTQIVFVRLLDKIALFDGKSLFSTWLYRLTQNECISLWRNQRRKSVPQKHLAVTLDSVTTLRHGGLSPLATYTLKESLDTLSGEQREEILLHTIDGLSAAESCKKKGIKPCPKNIAQVRQHRIEARRRLKNALGSRSAVA